MAKKKLQDILKEPIRDCGIFIDEDLSFWEQRRMN